MSLDLDVRKDVMGSVSLLRYVRMPSVLSMATEGQVPRTWTFMDLELTTSKDEMHESKTTWHLAHASTVTELHLPLTTIVAS